MLPKVSVNILTWNGKRYLPELLDSIDAQTFRDFSVRVIDNGSDDGTVQYLTENRPDIMLVRNVKNHGFAAGHNQGIRYVLDRLGEDKDNRYILIVNQDTILEPSYLERLVAEADVQPQVGALTGKLLRAYGENLNDEYLRQTVKSERIDSTGLRPNRWRRFTDRGAGEMDEGQYDKERDIFGPSGALAMYRASSLADVAIDGEYFDENFFSYKEDIDLVWRMQNAGWKARYVPEAKAYHFRGMYGAEKGGVLARIKDRRGKRPFFAALSTRNHWLVLIKNERWWRLILAMPLIIPIELGRVGYMLLFEARLLWVVPSALKLIPKMIKKRWKSKNKKRSKAREIYQWFR